MKKKQNPPADAADAAGLRRRAEARLSQRQKRQRPEAGEQRTAEDTARLVHELQVHQVELEMQNEELRHAQHELEASREKFVDLYDFAPVGYCTSSEAGHILEANLTAATLLGVARSELLQQPLTRFIVPEDLDILHRHRQRLFETRTRQTCELRLTRKDSPPFWARLDCILAQGPDDAAPMCRTTLSDITARKQAEEAAAHQLAILDATPDFVGFAAAGDGRLLYINPAGRKMTGVGVEEDMTRLKMADVHPEWTNKLLREQAFPSAIRDGVWTGECAFLHRDGHEIPVTMVLLAHKTQGGEMERFSTISRDITERKRAEQGLVLQALRTQALLDLHQISAAPRERILDFVQDASLRITQSELGFLGLLDDAEAVLSIHRWSEQIMTQCAVAGKPLRLPVAGAGLWAECVRRRQPVVVNDYAAPHPAKQGMPAGHVPIRRLLAVPILNGGRVVAVAAVANKPEDYTADDTHALILLATRMWEILHRQQAAAELERLAQFERLAQVMKCANDIILLTDEHGRILEANDRALETYGCSLAELRRKTLEDLRTAASRAELPHQTEQLETDGRAVFEAVHQRRDGSVFPVEISARFLEIGGARCRLGIVRDITARKQAEQALRWRETELRTILESTADGILALDNHGKVIRVNRRFAVLWWIPPPLPDAGDDRALLDSVLDQLCEPEAFLKKVRALYGSASLEMDLLTCKDGRVFEYFTEPMLLEGVILGRVWSFRNVTERKRAEQQLRESEQRLDRVVKNINDALIVDDVAGRLVYANQKFFRLFGIPEQELHSITLEDYAAPEWRAGLRDRHDRRIRGEPVPEHFEYEGVHRDGTRLWLEVSVAKVVENGRITGTQSAIRDITERKRAEHEARELPRLLLQAHEEERRQIGKELHDSVAQDLAAVVMSLSTAKKRLAGGDAEARALVADCLAVLGNSAKDVRNLSHLLHPPFLEEVGLLGALRQYVAGFCRRSGLKVNTEFPETWARLAADAELALFRVAQEALSNVRRHSGSRIVTVRLERTDDTATLEVADQGHGLAGAAAAGELAGGIGIAGMRERLRHIGGTLEIESSEHGTTVRAMLRAKPA